MLVLVKRWSRIGPPVLLFLALVFSSLPFTGVSIDAGKLRSELQTLSAGPLTGDETACVDAIGTKTYLTYSTFDLVTGTQPALDSSMPATCHAFETGPGASGTSSGGADASHYAIGVQPLAAVAAGIVLLALGLSLMRSPLRGAVIAPLLLIGVVLMLAEQFVAQSSIAGVLPSGASDLFDVSPQSGYTVLLVLLSVTALACAIDVMQAQRRSRAMQAA